MFLLHRASSSNNSCNNSMFVPSINYMSMILDNCSDPGQTMEINAMAMKYLNDDQLTQMAKMSQGNSGMRKSSSDKILQRVIAQCRSSASDVSMSPDMTMDTQKYLEKHGLLGSENNTFVGSRDPSIFDHNLRLNTDFSMVASSHGHNASQWYNSYDGDVSGKMSQPSSPIKSLNNKQSFKSRNNIPAVSSSSSEDDEPPVLENKRLPNYVASQLPQRDLGASPVLRGVLRTRKTGQLPYHNVSASTEDEGNILDIEKLKQLPKLL